ncbi:MAG TPA: cytochrome C [Thiobacillaceae bacterium]|nr:cytochrome C [Thiobacillaceae bacterium]
MKITNLIAGAAACAMLAFPAHAVDEADANKLLKDSKCLKCHSVDKKKDGPSYKEVAAKYKDKPDAVAKLTKHVSEPSRVEIDGVEEDHGAVKTRDAARIKNLVEWILSR